MSKFIFFLIGLPIYLSMAGCLVTIKAYPDSSIDMEAEINAMEEFLSSGAIAKYNQASDSARNNMSKREWRNALVEARLRESDLQFHKYQQQLFQQGVGLGIITDWLVLGLGGWGTLVKSQSQALSAASTGIVGAKASFDRNAYFDKTLPTLIATMEANRKEVLVRIRRNLLKPDSDYNLMAALNDVDSYKNAGSITAAITEVAANAGETAKEADRVLKANLTVKPVPMSLQVRREKAADFVRKMEESQLKTLAKALGLSTDDEYLSLQIRLKISAAESEDSFNVISQKIKILFNEEI